MLREAVHMHMVKCLSTIMVSSLWDFHNASMRQTTMSDCANSSLLLSQLVHLPRKRCLKGPY